MTAISWTFQDFHDSSSRDWRLAYPSAYAWREPREEVRVKGTVPQWWGEVAPRLLHLLQLQQDWDPRGARAISREDIDDALQFLNRVMGPDTPAPWIGPLASGGVELAWRGDNVEMEAIFDRARGERELLVSVGHNESEVPIEHAESLFAQVVDRLTGDPVPA